MGESGFGAIRKSVTRTQNTVKQYIVTRPILDLCEQSTQWPVARVSRRWWEKAGIDLEGENKRAAATEAATDSKSESDSDSGVNDSS